MSRVAESGVDDLALKWLALDTHARMIVDQRLRIRWTNDEAARELGRRRDMESDAGMLRTINRGLQRQLQDFVGACTSTLASWNLPRGDGDGHLIIRAQRLSVDEVKAGDGAAGCTYGLLFFGTGRDFEPHYANLDKVFSLTASEHRVLLAMIGGHDAIAAAALLDVSIETVRSHIRNIYSKIGVASREALFFKLRPYRL